MSGIIELGKHWLRQWLAAWWHQAITWTNVDFDMSRGLWYDGLLRAISQEVLQKFIDPVSLRTRHLNILANPIFLQLHYMMLFYVAESSVNYMIDCKNFKRPC